MVKFLDGMNFFVAVIADNIKYEQYMTGTAAKYTSEKNCILIVSGLPVELNVLPLQQVYVDVDL